MNIGCSSREWASTSFWFWLYSVVPEVSSSALASWTLVLSVFGCWGLRTVHLKFQCQYCSLLFFFSYLRAPLTLLYLFRGSANRLSVRWHVVFPLYSLHSCHSPYSKFRNLAVLFVRYVHFHFGNFQLSCHGTCFRRFMSARSLQVTEKCDSRVSLVQTSYLGSVPFSDHFRKSSHLRSDNFSSLGV